MTLKRATEKEKKWGRRKEKEGKRDRTKALGFGPVPWWGVVWKEERLWEKNTTPQYVLLSFTSI